MTRSEERLQVGTQTREAGRARLRKYVVTENVTQTVPVSHEEVRIEREPITDANVGDATSGPAISEEEHEVVLHEERPVVAKEAVPVERVRLDKETVTDQADGVRGGPQGADRHRRRQRRAGAAQRLIDQLNDGRPGAYAHPAVPVAGRPCGPTIAGWRRGCVRPASC